MQLTKAEGQDIINESMSIKTNPRQVFSVGMLDAVARVLKATIVPGTCIICGDDKHLIGCTQCDNPICAWCADDHHGLCCPVCLDIQQREEYADIRFDMRER